MDYANTPSLRGTRDWWDDDFRERLDLPYFVPPSSHGRITHLHVSKRRRSSTTLDSIVRVDRVSIVVICRYLYEKINIPRR